LVFEELKMADDTLKRDSGPKEDIFFRLFSAHQREVYSYIVTLVPSSADAEDIFQETASVLWRKFDEFTVGTSFASWACKIAYFIILDYRRKTCRHSIRYSTETLKLLSDSCYAMQAGRGRRMEALDECLKNLSERERNLVHLRYYKSLSVQAIAEQAGKSMNLIYKSLARVHYFLFECVQRTMAMEER
jgi:RNA polymerase sigma-70 factor (ECF subfamily)